ncbi:MAG: methyl-accepting chemotaxis protein [Clostridia bacterium]|nr:methyl-accepting chemotaxis protein [Clostridia bacterium]
MNQNGILVKNECEANRLSATIMLLTIIFAVLVYVLDVVGIFIVDLKVMTIAIIISIILDVIPAFVVFLLKKDSWWVKYLNVTVATLMIAEVSMFLSYHIVVLYVFGVAIASLYFSKGLSWYAVGLSIIALSISQICGVYYNFLEDKNYVTVPDAVIFGVIPKALLLLLLSLIFTVLAKRTRNMLENVMGAEEQKNMLERISSIVKKSSEVSVVLANSVKHLSEITTHTTRANEQIAENTSNIAAGSEDTLKYIDEASNAVEAVSKNLNRIADENRFIADISMQVNEMTQRSGLIIKDAVNEMQIIEKTTEESKETIYKLGERSSEIGKIIEVITGIAGQTNLLALNAAIESARAGEHGKGFAVVAEEIRKLAEQSQRAAKDISNLIKEVLADTEKAVDAMDRGSQFVGKGLGVINEAGKAFDKASAAGMEVNDKIQEISGVTRQVAESGNRITEIVYNIKNINHKSIGELQNIAAASEEQLASMEQVASSVDTIEKISKELLDVVNEK